MRTFLSLLLLGTAAFSTASYAQEKNIDVDDAYAYATSHSQTSGAIFMEIENTPVQDRLIAASTPVAGKAELHTSTVEGGVAQMRAVVAYDLPADGTIELKPSGNHIMLTGLKGPLVAGESFPLTLTFEKQGTKNVTVKIVPPGTDEDGDVEHDAHGHDHH